MGVSSCWFALDSLDLFAGNLMSEVLLVFDGWCSTCLFRLQDSACLKCLESIRGRVCAIEGGAVRSFDRAKKWLYLYPEAGH